MIDCRVKHTSIVRRYLMEIVAVVAIVIMTFIPEIVALIEQIKCQ